VLVDAFGGTTGCGNEDEAKSKEGPGWKLNELSEREIHSIQVEEGEERTGRSLGPCCDCDREECEEDEEGDKLEDGAGSSLRATCN
jgi:hypothetical protein